MLLIHETVYLLINPFVAQIATVASLMQAAGVAPNDTTKQILQ